MDAEYKVGQVVRLTKRFITKDFLILAYVNDTFSHSYITLLDGLIYHIHPTWIERVLVDV